MVVEEKARLVKRKGSFQLKIIEKRSKIKMKVKVVITGTLEKKPKSIAALKELSGPKLVQVLIDEAEDYNRTIETAEEPEAG